MTAALALDTPHVTTPTGAVEAACPHCGTRLGRGAEGAFCCHGCAAAFALVNELGLQQYYARRTLDPAARPPRPEETQAADLGAYVAVDAEGRASLNLLVDGLHCAACVWLIETVLKRQPDVSSARVNLGNRRLTLSWQGDKARAEALVESVRQLGYRVVPFDPRVLAGGRSRDEQALLRALAVAGFAAMNVMLLSVSVWAGHGGEMGQATRDLMHWVSALVALPAVAYAGQPFFRSAVAALRAGRTNMDVPISIGVLLACAASLAETIQSGAHAYFDSAITLLFFLLAGRYLDTLARGRARETAEHLLGLLALPATVVAADGSLRQMPAARVTSADVVAVAAGERIPVDGIVALGQSDLDRSLIDGETTPVCAAPGTIVYAGTLNITAPLRIRASAAGESTLLAEIVRLTEVAEQGRARFVVLADRVARRYAPTVHLLALTTFLAWITIGGLAWPKALLIAIAVLIITCPCALGLAVPVVQVLASGRLMRRGILLKSATALERLADVDTVVFDKTGTLTLAELDLTEAGRVDHNALAVAASLAGASRHPLSRAIQRACPAAAVAGDVTEVPGQGLLRRTPDGEIRLGSANFCGIADDASLPARPALFLARPGHAPHRFDFVDRLRPDAAPVVATLRAEGKRVLLLSGDRRAVVEDVAGLVGIADWQAELGPVEKRSRIAALAATGAKVMMVGDGLNDAPALALAHVSMAPASGADISQSAADIVFLGASLDAVRRALVMGRASGALARQNIALAILYNAIAVPLAMAGLVTPLIAAIAMSSSSLLVVGNALRLTWRDR